MRRAFPTPFIALLTLAFVIGIQNIRAQNPPASPQTPPKHRPQPSPNLEAYLFAEVTLHQDRIRAAIPP